MSLLVGGGTIAVPLRRISAFTNRSIPSLTNLSCGSTSVVVLARRGGLFSRTCLPDNRGRNGSVTTAEEEEEAIIKQDNEELEMNFNNPIDNDDIENEKLQLMGLSFGSKRELVKGVRAFLSKRGYHVKVRRSSKNSVIWGCDGGGFSEDTHDVPIKQRNGTTPSHLTGCPFKIKGKRHDDGLWRIEIINYLHNHEALVDETGLPIFRQLSEEDIRTIEHMSNSGVPPREILFFLQQMYHNMPAASKIIYDARHRICKERLAGRSHIQALFEELGKGGFMYDISNEGGHPTHLFFAHPLSVQLTQNFPNIFIMDSTYKNSRYKMPLLDITGISSFNTSFYSGFAFLKGESEEDYIWALKMFSKNLGEKQPKVIITDGQNALINAINIVFPECTHLISVWHTEKDISINCKKYFETQENWEDFLGSWRRVIYSSTELEYNEQWKELESSYAEKKEVVEYIENVWIPLKEKFVSAWTDEYLHFGNHAKSKAETAHIKLKKNLQVSAGNFHEVGSKVCLAIENEFSEIKMRLSHEQRVRLKKFIHIPFFKDVITRISRYALKELWKQYMKVELGTMSPVCSGRFTKTMGLPCAHQMSKWKNGTLSLDLIHSQWRLEGKVLSSPTALYSENHDDGRVSSASTALYSDNAFAIMLEELRTKYQEWPAIKKDVAREKISELLSQSDVLLETNNIQPSEDPSAQLE